jgi:polar amino acid transport system substrate-binding protein
MKRISIIVLGLVLIGFLGGLLFGPLPRTIVVGYHEDFPPYAYHENGKLAGIFPEMVKKAVAKMGIRAEFRKLPWRRLLRGAEVGDLDAIMPLFKTEEREKFLLYPPNGIAVGESYFFALNNSNIRYNDELENLKGLRIGVVNGYSYGEDFDNAGFLTKDVTPSDEQLVEKLLSGRCDVAAGPMEVVRYYAEKIQPGASKRIKIIAPPFAGKIIYVAFSKAKNDRELVTAFSNAVQKVRKEGTHQKILEKYKRAEDIAFFKEIVIGADREAYPPYCYWQDGKLDGACTELIDRAAEHMGIPIRFKKIKWQDFTTLAELGEIDAVMPLFRTEKREKSFFFPKHGLAAEKIYFFTLSRSKVNYSGDLKDFKRVRLGVVKDYSYGRVFDAATYLDKYKKKADSVDHLVDMLMKKKVKVIAAEKRVVDYLVKKKNITGKIKTIGPSLPREFLHLAFSNKEKGNRKVARSFSDALRFLRKRGDYKEIMEKYKMNNRRVRLAADNWQPYYGENLPLKGPITEIITLAFNRMGYDVEIEFIPWASLLEKVKKGKYDAGFAASFAPGRESHYYFSDLIAHSSHTVFFKRIDTDIVYTGLKDLLNYRIGVVRGYYYDKDFDTYPGLMRIESNSADINLRNLLRNRLHLALVDKRHACYLLERMAKNDSNLLEYINMYPYKEDVRHQMCLLISKESIEAEQIRMDFNYGLGMLFDEGNVDAILKRHGVKDEIRFPAR